jgi:hypothetical protein
MRSIPVSPSHDRPKASEWRWMEYSEPIPILNKPASRLYEAIKKAAKIDQGTSSTFDALAARGLVQVGVRGPDGYPHLRMTAAGRKLARSWTGTQTYKAPPAGTLKEWHWRALAKAYAAGEEGLEGSYGDYANIGWNIRLRLRDFKRGALTEERVGYGTTPRLDRQAPGIGSTSPAPAGRGTSESGPATASSIRTWTLLTRHESLQPSENHRQKRATRVPVGLHSAPDLSDKPSPHWLRHSYATQAPQPRPHRDMLPKPKSAALETDSRPADCSAGGGCRLAGKQPTWSSECLFSA